MRSVAESAAFASILALGMVSVGGCLGEGQPWGLVEVELAVGFEVGPSRLEAGRLKTARDYRIAIESVELRVETVELVASGGSNITFDPSRPPPGYSLCHNGHCHADDGRLVDYEDIVRELAGGAGGGTANTLVSLQGGTGRPALDGRDAVELGSCEAVAGCPAPYPIDEPVDLGLVRALIGRVAVRGVAFDARVGEAARLDEAGLPFEVVLEGVGEGLFAVAEPGLWRFGPSERLGLALGVLVGLPAEIFDGVEWSTMDREAVDEAVGVALREGTGLKVNARRFD